MYYRLYHLTEEPGVINGILLDSIRTTGIKYNEINKQRQILANEFSQVISGGDYYSDDQSAFYWNDDAITINIFLMTLMWLFLDTIQTYLISFR